MLFLTLDQFFSLSAAFFDKPLLVKKSQRFRKDDTDFFGKDIEEPLHEGIIELASSPQKAQVVVVKDPSNRHKNRLCVDYSRTINQYTELDAYPLLRIKEIVNKLAEYNLSTFDLKWTYHQIPLLQDEKKFMAFKAIGKLSQYRRIPFGLTNGVAVL